MTDMSAYEIMRAGQTYGMPDSYLIGLQIEARTRRDAYNATPMRENEQRQAMLKDMLGSFGTGMILSPVVWEYGKHIHFGERVFVNFDCVFLDGADIRIGSSTVIGPRAQFLTAGHPLDPSERIRLDPETGNPGWQQLPQQADHHRQAVLDRRRRHHPGWGDDR